MLELAYRRGVTGTDLAQTLGLSYDSTKKLVRRLRNTIERSLGALLVARHAARIGCPQLAASLSGWDEQFSVLMRKRIVRHIDSCSTCTEYRRSVVNAVVMLGGGVLNKVSSCHTPAARNFASAQFCGVPLSRNMARVTAPRPMASLARRTRRSPSAGMPNLSYKFCRCCLMAASVTNSS